MSEQNPYKVTVVDYRTSNLLSITKALQKVGGIIEMTNEPEAITRAEKLVLPGVGAFGAAIRNMETLGIKQAVTEFGKSGKPLIGICLGMQLLFSVSFELGINDGLNLIPGDVVAFPQGIQWNNSPLKVPHMGWNKVEFSRPSRLFRDLEGGQYAYFVHSYYAKADDSYVTGMTNYGVQFPAMVENENVFGIQFHPEKSQTFGLKILENFLRI